MEARAYGSGPRTRFVVRRPSPGSLAVAATAAAALGITVAARLSGLDDDWYPYPTVTTPALHPLMLAACVLLLTPVMAWRRRPSAG
jgi:hypothetical protein